MRASADLSARALMHCMKESKPGIAEQALAAAFGALLVAVAAALMCVCVCIGVERACAEGAGVVWALPTHA